jgi:predicted small secreted protein
MIKAQTRKAPNRSEFNWLFALVASLLMAFALSACNTVEGMGEDVSAAGGAMSDTADDVKDEM